MIEFHKSIKRWHYWVSPWGPFVKPLSSSQLSFSQCSGCFRWGQHICCNKAAWPTWSCSKFGSEQVRSTASDWSDSPCPHPFQRRPHRLNCPLFSNTLKLIWPLTVTDWDSDPGKLSPNPNPSQEELSKVILSWKTISLVPKVVLAEPSRYHIIETPQHNH